MIFAELLAECDDSFIDPLLLTDDLGGFARPKKRRGKYPRNIVGQVLRRVPRMFAPVWIQGNIGVVAVLEVKKSGWPRT